MIALDYSRCKPREKRGKKGKKKTALLKCGDMQAKRDKMQRSRGPPRVSGEQPDGGKHPLCSLSLSSTPTVEIATPFVVLNTCRVAIHNTGKSIILFRIQLR